jgi:hypothetical protein
MRSKGFDKFCWTTSESRWRGRHINPEGSTRERHTVSSEEDAAKTNHSQNIDEEKKWPLAGGTQGWQMCLLALVMTSINTTVKR